MQQLAAADYTDYLNTVINANATRTPLRLSLWPCSVLSGITYIYIYIYTHTLICISMQMLTHQTLKNALAHIRWSVLAQPLVSAAGLPRERFASAALARLRAEATMHSTC